MKIIKRNFSHFLLLIKNARKRLVSCCTLGIVGILLKDKKFRLSRTVAVRNFFGKPTASPLKAIES
jgi:hypothetical protein